jgi:hypothetical protein
MVCPTAGGMLQRPVGEQTANLAFPGFLLHKTDVHAGKPPLAIDQQRHRHGFRSVALRQLLIADRHRVVQLVFREVRHHRFPAIVVHRNTDHGQPARFVSGLEILQHRHLDTAWSAPGSPKFNTTALPR